MPGSELERVADQNTVVTVASQPQMLHGHQKHLQLVQQAKLKEVGIGQGRSRQGPEWGRLEQAVHVVQVAYVAAAMQVAAESPPPHVCQRCL
jgi:hypothetical protein